MKRIFALLLVIIMLIGLVSCGGGGDNPPDNDPPAGPGSGEGGNGSGEGGSGSGEGGNGEGGSGGEPGEGPGEGEKPGDDPVVPPTVEVVIPGVSEMLGDKMDSFNGSAYVEKSTTSDFYGEVIDIDVSKDANNRVYQIKDGGAYRLFGKSLNGAIYIKAADQDIYLVLDGVDLTNNGSAPAIYAEDCKSVTVIITEGSVNYLKDSSKNGENGVLRVRSCNLTIDGQGTLNIVANKKHGISNTKELTIKGGTFNITTPTGEGHAVYGKLGVTVNSGNFTINAGKSGFKSGDVADDGTIERGYITINYAHTDITCGTNAFNCQGPVQINNGYFKINANTGNGIDATGDVTISNSIVVINSDKSGIATDGDISITGATNLKVETNGNGISGDNISVTTSGVVYIKTTALYERYNASESTEENPTLYVLENGSYVLYDSEKHSTSIFYTRRNCKGLNADNGVDITSSLVGIDSYEDCINALTLSVNGANLVLNTACDGVEADIVTIDANITILNAQKGIKGETSLQIDGGTVTVNASIDSLNSDNTVINAGNVYLFDKIDKGTEGKVEVNGGTVIMLSTTKSAQITEGSQRYRSGKVTNADKCIAGSWVKITAGEFSVVLYLPKDYSSKMALYYSGEGANGKITVEFGSYEKGTEINPFAYENGTFTAEASEQI